MDEHTLRKIVRDEVRPLVHQVSTMNRLMTGNGEPERGLVVRVDRLEQTEKRRMLWIKSAIGAAVAAAIGSIVQWFR